jgi:hypothetical protein
MRQAPASLSYKNKGERRKIHRFVYGETLRTRGGHIDLDAIEALAAELLERDPEQAERFFGNRIVHGQGTFIPNGLWESRTEPVDVRAGTPVALGFDGSSSGDWTAIRAETIDGHRFTPTYLVGADVRSTVWNPAVSSDGRIPRGEVRAAMTHLFASYNVVRLYCDPRDWQTEIDEWAMHHGADKVVQWPTNQIARMHDALNRYLTDLTEGRTSHSQDTVAAAHAANARMIGKPGDRFILAKPAEHQKIDVLMADVLAHEAAADARSEGWTGQPVDTRVVVFR